MRLKIARTREDIGTARLVARALRDIAAGDPLIPKGEVDRLVDDVKSKRLRLSRRRRETAKRKT